MPEKIICEICGHSNIEGTKYCKECGNILTQYYYKGLWLKNIIITLLVFFLPFVILFYIVNFEVSANFEKQIKNSLDYSVEVNVRIIKLFLNERKKDLLSIAKSDISNLNQINTKHKFFQTFITEKPWFDLIAIVNPNGDIIFSTDNIKGNIKNHEYFQRSNKGSFFNSSIFYSDILDTTVMIISSPFFNLQNKIIGVIFASISLSSFYNLIFDLRIGRTSEIFLVDDKGIFLSPSKLGGSVLREMGHYKEELNPHQGEGGVLTHRDYRGERVLCAFRKFTEPNWYLISEIDIKEALAPVTALKRIIFSIFIIFGSFLVFSSVFFSKQIIDSIKNLTRSLKSAFDEITQKKNTINTINIELRKRLKECETLSKELKISEEYSKNIINSIDSGLIAFDEKLRITFYNDYIKNFTTKKEIKIGDEIPAVLPIFEDKNIRQGIEEIFVKNKPFNIEKKQIVVDGKDIVVSINTFPMKGIEKVNGAILLLNDITEQEHLRNQMADYEKLSALSQLALGAAHEINNPLLGITSYLELLLDEEEDVEKKTRSKEVLDSAYRISETIRGLLNFARPTPPKFTKISLNKLITETVSFLHHQPLFRKIKFEKFLSEAVPQITADTNQVRQVLINILINAAQAMPDGGSIAITTEKVKFEELVEIRVIDTGIGILPEHLKRVFEPFFTTKKGEGTGLGLSISYSYVKNHNGQITIKSEVNNGTEVKIVLPIRQKGKIQSEVIE